MNWNAWGNYQSFIMRFQSFALLICGRCSCDLWVELVQEYTIDQLCSPTSRWLSASRLPHPLPVHLAARDNNQKKLLSGALTHISLRCNRICNCASLSAAQFHSRIWWNIAPTSLCSCSKAKLSIFCSWWGSEVGYEQELEGTLLFLYSLLSTPLFRSLPGH